MRNLLRTLLAIVGLALATTFAIANRQPVEISYWPLPFAQTLPLWVVPMAGIVIGVALGAAAMWLSGHRRRATLRTLRDRLSGYEHEARQRQEAERRAAPTGRGLTVTSRAA